MKADIRSIEQALAQDGKVIIEPTGRSMRPFIKAGRDRVIISAFKNNPKKYDIVLYKKLSGNYVLHRIVGFDKNGKAIICGDRLTEKEYGIEEILGVMSGIIRRGKIYPSDCLKFKLWARVWCCFPIRKAVLCMADFKNIIKKKFKRFCK